MNRPWFHTFVINCTKIRQRGSLLSVVVRKAVSHAPYTKQWFTKGSLDRGLAGAGDRVRNLSGAKPSWPRRELPRGPIDPYHRRPGRERTR